MGKGHSIVELHRPRSHIPGTELMLTCPPYRHFRMPDAVLARWRRRGASLGEHGQVGEAVGDGREGLMPAEKECGRGRLCVLDPHGTTF